MCGYFGCLSCRNNFVNRCKKINFESQETCSNIDPGMYFANCDTCHLINNAINQLDNLVFSAPFLQTKGLSGLDEVSSWEKAELQTMLIKSTDQASWEDKAESREERHSLAKKLESMGLKDLENCSVDHQGFDMALTPDKTSSTDSRGDLNSEDRRP